MKNIKSALVFFATLLIFTSCGDPEIDISEVKYEPKIAVQGFVYPGEPVSDILIMRNFPLEENISELSLILTPSGNSVSAYINGIALSYDPATGSYYTNDLTIDYNTAYTLEVNAVIDGNALHAKSTTITPANGFEVIEETLGTIKYRSKPIEFNFHPSPGTDAYVFSIMADTARIDNFIYENPYFPDYDKKDLEDNFNNFRFQMRGMINIDSYNVDQIKNEIKLLDTWFYSSYTVIAYAGDKNYKDYIITAGNVQEFDGNFVEPEMHFEGDGIGIFGGAIRDTLTFILVK